MGGQTANGQVRRLYAGYDDASGVGGPGAAPGEADALLWTVTTQRVLGLLTRKWVVSVVRVLENGPRRPFQMRIAMKGVQAKVLRETLKALETEGLVERVLMCDDVGGRCIGWTLTEQGQSLVVPLATLFRWGRDHLPGPVVDVTDDHTARTRR